MVVPGPWQWTDGDHPVEYRRMCQKGGRWGSWTNGAAIWHREKLHSQVGMLNEQVPAFLPNPKSRQSLPLDV
eukprot:2273849-Rhodomonas_salina.2